MKKAMYFAVAVLALAACQKQNPQEPVSSDLVKIEPVITKATSTNFEEGDKVGVDIIIDELSPAKHADNACLTYSEADQAFSSDLKWYADGGKTCTIKAFYPYQASGFPTSFTVAADQSTGAGASDFMVSAKTGVYPQRNAVTMQFKHYLSQIVVEVTNSADADIEFAKLSGLVAKANIAVDGETITVTPDSQTDPSDILGECLETNKKFRFIVVPQESTLQLELKIAQGNVLVTDIPSSILKQGYTYTIKATVTPDNVKATLAGEIQNWLDGGELNGQQKKEVSFHEYLSDGYIEYDNVNYDVVKLRGKYWMASPLAYIPEGLAASDDPSKGSIWYPYNTVVDDSTTPATVTTTANKTAAAIAEFGYLYKTNIALGIADSKITDDIFTGFTDAAIEADPTIAQGICPKGWHVPSAAEMKTLVGSGNAPYATADTDASFWDASITPTAYATLGKAFEKGWTGIMAGCVVSGKYNALLADESVSTVPAYASSHRMTYIITSTYRAKSGSNYQFFGAMTTFTKSASPLGKLSLSFNNHSNGAQLRCVRDK